MISIAIDGPAGAGKSTVAQKVASRLGYIYVNTGSFYRAVSFYLICHGIKIDNEDLIENTLPKINFELKFLNGKQIILLENEDISQKIRSEQVSTVASKISALKSVRLHLLDMQRKIADENNVVMDGRDIGTVVLPHATVKIFLTASANERANRRFREIKKGDKDITFEQVLNSITQRDYRDSKRDIAPLKPAESAIILDSTHLTFSNVVLKILEIVRAHCQNNN
ncbi:MAG: (d)CMP kinase [Oscillospiraceae bacterium]|jgi:cytidylate kinase|nr:(d)CMP kinase [Oscillospiraceae bacterium]